MSESSDLQAAWRAMLLKVCRQLHVQSPDERLPPTIWLDADDAAAAMIEVVKATASVFDDSRHPIEAAYPAALAAAQEKA